MRVYHHTSVKGELMKLNTDRSSQETSQDQLSEFCDAIATHILGWPDAHKLAWGALKARPLGRLEFLIKPQSMQAQLERQLRADQSSHMVACIHWEQGSAPQPDLRIQARTQDGASLTVYYSRATHVERQSAQHHDDSGSP